jgi:23S rRNA (guanosine2251-2'-O)-methyltransferase
VNEISNHPNQDQGVVAVFRRPEKAIASVADFLSSQPDQYTLLALEGISSASNMGTIIRTAAAAASVDAVVVLGDCCDVLSPMTTFASCGINLRAKYIHTQSLEELKRDGASIYALHNAATRSLFTLGPLPKKVVWLLGSETGGLTQQSLSNATEQVSIPMARGVESLSVAHTAALVAFYPQFVHK